MTKHFSSNFGNFFDEILDVLASDTGIKFSNLSNAFPFCNIYKDEENVLHFDFALAGYKKELLHLSVDRGMLTVEYEDEKEKDIQVYIHKGIKDTPFKRTFALPHGYDDSEYEAKFEDGILKVSIKLDESKKPKEIKIS